jgi:hypothetical protein
MKKGVFAIAYFAQTIHFGEDFEISVEEQPFRFCQDTIYSG